MGNKIKTDLDYNNLTKKTHHPSIQRKNSLEIKQCRTFSEEFKRQKIQLIVNN